MCAVVWLQLLEGKWHMSWEAELRRIRITYQLLYSPIPCCSQATSPQPSGLDMGNSNEQIIELIFQYRLPLSDKAQTERRHKSQHKIGGKWSGKTSGKL